MELVVSSPNVGKLTKSEGELSLRDEDSVEELLHSEGKHLG
jgi:hypothetical protein